MRTPRRLVVATSFFLIACGAKWHANTTGSGKPPPGSATMQATVPGLTLNSATAVAIARTRAPTLQIKLAVSSLTCTSTLGPDHITIDLGALTTGTFTVVKGYPQTQSLASFQARAHACNGSSPGAADAGPTGCHEEVTSGDVTITRLDDPGGIVEGSFDVVFVDGEISGDFSARRCD